MNRKYVYGLCSAAVLLSAAASYMGLQKKETRKEAVAHIRVCQVVEHEALTAVVTGLKEVLAADTSRRYNVTVDTCQGNAATAAQMLEKSASTKTDVAVTIGTLPSQVAYKLAKEGRLNVVFASVTNPEDIAPSFEKTTMTGVSNFVALRPQIEMFLKIQPSLKTLGMIYNTSEANSVYIVKQMEGMCQEMGLRLVAQGISKMADLRPATEKILPSVDALFVSNDNLVLSCMENLCSLCTPKGVPVYVSDTDQVAKGCVAALGPNQVDIGRQAGQLVLRILNGEKPMSIPVQYPQKTELVVNTKGAIPVPPEVFSQATKVFPEQATPVSLGRAS